MMKVDYKQVRETIEGTGKNIWFAGLGVLSTVEKTARNTFDDLVAKGKNRDENDVTMVEKSFDTVVEQVKTVSDKVDQGVKETTRATLNRFGVPSSDQIQDLIARVETLNKKVEEMGN